MKTVRQLLQAKGGTVHSVSPDTRVFEALKLMAEKEIGALLVTDGGALVGIIVGLELIMVVLTTIVSPGSLTASAPVPPTGSGITNTEAIGQVLYTKYAYFFEAAGLILLVAMIGAIVLTLRHKEGVKRQSVAAQVARRKSASVRVVKVAPGTAAVPPARSSSR